jgi:hypothetical protein
MLNRFLFAVVLPGLALCASCSPPEKESVPPGKPLLAIPAVYDTSSYRTATTEQAALLIRFRTLVDELKKGRNPANILSGDVLVSLFTTGSPGLYPYTLSSFRDFVSGGEASWLAEAARASGKGWSPGTPPADGSVQGGVFGTGSSAYLFDENGVEIEQLVEKGLFGALLFHQMNQIFNQPFLTPADVDKALCLSGSNPTFPNTSTAAKAARPDAFFAVYLARRDKNNGNGFYSQFKNGFIKLQAAVKAGDAYKAEQAEAIGAIRNAMERANAATIINYCQTATSTLSQTTVSDGQRAASLHAIGEAIGFLWGYRGLANKSMRETTLDGLWGKFNCGPGQNSGVYRFATQPESELNKLTEVISVLKAEYNFSDAEIDDFKKNWITEQGR